MKELGKLEKFTTKKEVVEAMLKASKQQLNVVWISGEQTFDSGVHKKVNIIVPVKQAITGLESDTSYNLMHFWYKNSTLEVGKLYQPDNNFNVTIVSKIKHFKGNNHINVLNVVVNENVINRLESEVKNPLSMTYKVKDWFGTAYKVQPTSKDIDKLIDVCEENQTLTEELQTACNVLGMSFDVLFTNAESFAMPE